MKKFNLETIYGVENGCIFVLNKYKNNDSLAISIYNNDGEAVCNLSINIVWSSFINKNQFYVKDYDGMEIIAKSLVELGLIKDLKEKVSQGYGIYNLYELTEKAMDYVWRD